MKKRIALLLALLLLALPAALAAGLEYTTDTLQDGSLVFYFDDLSLTLPSGWADAVLAIPTDSGLSFYQRESYERYEAEGIPGGGFLFSLGASVNGSFSELPAFKYLGFSEKSAMNSNTSHRRITTQEKPAEAATIAGRDTASRRRVPRIRI